MNIKALRGKVAEKGLTQRELAKKMDYSKNTVNAILTGKKSPTLREVEKLCLILDINSDEDKIKIFLL